MAFAIDNIRYDDELGQARAKTFLAENPDPGVRERPDPLFRRAMDSGQALRVTEDSDYRGVSLVFDYDTGNGGIVYREIGSMRITAEGYRLQVFVAQFHLVQLHIEDFDNRCETFAVVAKGTASEHNLLTHVKMHGWSPSSDLRLLRKQAGAPFAPEKPVLLANGGTTKHAFSALRSLHIRDNVFRTPKGGSEIEVRMRWFHPSVLDEGPVS